MFDVNALRCAAVATLRANDRGGYTVPAPSLYPHQWNWDSAFCAIGWAAFDPRRAARELAMLARGQWADGMIPHILFNPAAEHYQPGPEVWQTVGAPGAPQGVRTSSITQPPVAATAARMVLERSGGDHEVETSLRALVPALERWHAWFLRDRDPNGEGLPCIVHPWESGMDNAPRWDAAMRRIDPGDVRYQRKDDTIVAADQRPTRADYDRYFFLVRERAAAHFAPPTPENASFLVQDAVIAALLYRAEHDLDALARALGADAPGALSRASRLKTAIETKLYRVSDARFLDFDLLAGETVDVDHVASMLPLFGGLASESAIDAVERRLGDVATYGLRFGVPTVPASDERFESRRYWRGPSWVNVNWLLVDGLRRAGRGKLADRLARETLELVAAAGFFEYFEPNTGEGLGGPQFSWTAALALDLLGAAA